MLHPLHARRRAVTRAVTTMAVMVALALMAASAAHAQSPNTKALVGSWVETVTFPPEVGRPPIKSLGTFHADGTMVCSDQGAVTTVGPQTGVFTSCHGVWTHVSQRTFAYTSMELISDLGGALVGYLKVRGEYTVDDAGTQYTGASFAQIVAVDGTVLFESVVTNAGERIQLELP
jgi:hypothetical protein